MYGYKARKLDTVIFEVPRIFLLPMLPDLAC